MCKVVTLAIQLTCYLGDASEFFQELEGLVICYPDLASCRIMGPKLS